MQIHSFYIPEVKIITPKKISDERGFFSETYHKKRLAEQGIEDKFVQDNHAFSARANTVRGLHFQIPPFAQAKLIRVISGAILDVAVDIRKGSPYYGRYVSAVISESRWNQIFIPAGFAHGLVTLEENTAVLYKVSNYFSPEHDKGLLWNDPDLGINWPVTLDEAILSDKDRQQPSFQDLPRYFVYGK